MAEMTLSEAQAQLSMVNIAIENLIQHKTINELKLGSSDFSRWYKYGEVSLDGLRAYRRELLDLINTIGPQVKPVFRSNACIPLIVTKGAVQ